MVPSLWKTVLHFLINVSVHWSYDPEPKKLEYISSAGLRVLISTQKKLQPEGIPFKIINSPGIIKDIITTSGLDNILNIEWQKFKS